ncbi:hypothetical protein HPB48_001407 [Haemaphysalis longicornis]|uniref:Uncharacterized protein n=1 Tax=Haemaphysalis longicornis TaxID=44386 RepID=A0A9J6GXB6_HAELO|nr:hypothetical protein HPB48_001407 [Haemaphysalis longicornis]
MAVVGVPWQRSCVTVCSFKDSGAPRHNTTLPTRMGSAISPLPPFLETPGTLVILGTADFACSRTSCWRPVPTSGQQLVVPLSSFPACALRAEGFSMPCRHHPHPSRRFHLQPPTAS